jgi:tetratricopeptide (TPR) repeat protein
MRKSVGLVAFVAATLAAPASAQSVKAGIEAWQKGDHAAAVAIWRPLAEAGDADASFNLGQAYRLGRGVETNLAAAQSWLERAARKNHVDAQATLGLLLFENADRQQALRWLKSAAERGEPRALLVYGTALFNGDGMRPDPVLGYAYVSRAAAQGLAPAKKTLAEMDAILPLEQRKKGVAIALEKAKQSEAPARAATPKERPKTPAPIARPTAAPGGWRIQLGAFSNRSSAEALFKRLSTSAPLVGKTLHLVPKGAITRLQVGPFESRAAAAAACSALSEKGQPCFPVAPARP